MTNTIGNYDFKDVEESTIEFWEKHDIYAKAKNAGEGKKSFFFVQGPPYTSGRIHLGQAWNNGMKDMVLRYKRMKGFDVFDRAAYDMHGLPTAHKVMAKHKLESKEDIQEFGVEKFINECITWSKEKAEVMSNDLGRLGIWMDFKNACLPINNSYIEGEWFLIKKAHEKGRLYEGRRTMSWCASCQTAMAKHECEYKEVTENSIFVKFPVKGKEKEFLIIWTTTPWTITYNLAVMVHPKLEYVKAKVGDETWVLAKGLAGPVVQNFTDHKLELIDEFPGKNLEGLEYEHPWNNKWNHYAEIKAKHPKTHTVILSEEYVNLSAGTGLVHCAPGCGPEDYEVGYRNNIPAFNNLKEDGHLPEGMAEFSGLAAKKDDKKFIESMKEEGILVASTPVEHDYAHCQRCHNPVIFRTTKQWFFKIEDLKERMLKANNEVHWVPEEAQNAFRGWLENLRDNSITKQRFWGTPVPIWKCDGCDKFEVIGSAAELKEKAGHCPENLHKPWIDDVHISCDCGGTMKRLPDILDVWIDAGTLSWNVLDYPNRTDFFEKLYPADFILEGKDQIRGWFNLLMISSFIAFDKPSFKNCYMHGFITDVDGVKMSKSLGNVISPYELIDKYGADTLRYYMSSITAGEDVNFSWDEAKLKNRNLGVLWNIHKYLIEFSRQNDFEHMKISSSFGDVEKYLRNEEKYLISKTFSTINKVTELYEKYDLDEIPKALEGLLFEFSRTYIQITRETSVSGSDEEKQAMFYSMYISLINLLKMLSTVTPFICEKTYQNLKTEFGLPQESITLYDWPEVDDGMIDVELEEKFEVAKGVIQAILSAREKAKLGVRWPIGEVIIASTDPKIRVAVEDLSEIIQRQTNVKQLTMKEEFESLTLSVKADYAKLGPEFGAKAPQIIAQLTIQSPESIFEKVQEHGKTSLIVNGESIEITKEHLIVKREVPEPYIDGDFRGGYIYLDTTRNYELDAEGYSREVMRRVQSLRKTSGLQKQDNITLYLQVSEELKGMLDNWTPQIMEKVGATTISVKSGKPSQKYEHSKEEKLKNQTFVIFFDKVK